MLPVMLTSNLKWFIQYLTRVAIKYFMGVSSCFVGWYQRNAGGDIRERRR